MDSKTMKKLLLLLCLGLPPWWQCYAGVVKPAVATFNPHTGTAVDTPWDHKGTEATGVFRLLPPNSVEREIAAINGVSICKGNMSRCENASAIPICVDATGVPPSEKCKTWQIFELWRWRREAVQSRPQRVVLSISPTLSAVELFLGGGRYQPLYGYDAVNGIIELIPHPSNVNGVKVSQFLHIRHDRIQLFDHFYVLNAGGFSVGPNWIQEKEGVKYLKVKGPDGKQYGLKLEPLS